MRHHEQHLKELQVFNQHLATAKTINSEPDNEDRPEAGVAKRKKSGRKRLGGEKTTAGDETTIRLSTQDSILSDPYELKTGEARTAAASSTRDESSSSQFAWKSLSRRLSSFIGLDDENDPLHGGTIGNVGRGRVTEELKIPAGLRNMPLEEQITAAEDLIRPICEIPFGHRQRKTNKIGAERIHDVAKILKECPKLELIVEGHSGGMNDKLGEAHETRLLELSDERARVVHKMFLEEGIPNKIMTRCFGVERCLRFGIVKLVVCPPPDPLYENEDIPVVPSEEDDARSSKVVDAKRELSGAAASRAAENAAKLASEVGAPPIASQEIQMAPEAPRIRGAPAHTISSAIVASKIAQRFAVDDAEFAAAAAEEVREYVSKASQSCESHTQMIMIQQVADKRNADVIGAIEKFAEDPKEPRCTAASPEQLARVTLWGDTTLAVSDGRAKALEAVAEASAAASLIARARCEALAREQNEVSSDRRRQADAKKREAGPLGKSFDEGQDSGHANSWLGSINNWFPFSWTGTDPFPCSSRGCVTGKACKACDKCQSQEEPAELPPDFNDFKMSTIQFRAAGPPAPTPFEQQTGTIGENYSYDRVHEI